MNSALATQVLFTLNLLNAHVYYQPEFPPTCTCKGPQRRLRLEQYTAAECDNRIAETNRRACSSCRHDRVYYQRRQNGMFNISVGWLRGTNLFIVRLQAVRFHGWDDIIITCVEGLATYVRLSFVDPHLEGILSLFDPYRAGTMSENIDWPGMDIICTIEKYIKRVMRLIRPVSLKYSEQAPVGTPVPWEHICASFRREDKKRELCAYGYIVWSLWHVNFLVLLVHKQV